MSAREKLLAALQGELDECYCGGEFCDSAESLVDDFAHELAEQIRTGLPERVEKLGGGVFELHTTSTAQHAADLIDPEVSE